LLDVESHDSYGTPGNTGKYWGISNSLHSRKFKLVFFLNFRYLNFFYFFQKSWEDDTLVPVLEKKVYKHRKLIFKGHDVSFPYFL